MPKRIQRKRTKGWKMPPNTVYVGRPTIFGNPFPVDVYHEGAMDLFRRWLRREMSTSEMSHVSRSDWGTYSQVPVSLVHVRNVLLAKLGELRGKDLACWCKEDAPCHADILLELANG